MEYSEYRKYMKISITYYDKPLEFCANPSMFQILKPKMAGQLMAAGPDWGLLIS